VRQLLAGFGRVGICHNTPMARGGGSSIPLDVIGNWEAAGAGLVVELLRHPEVPRFHQRDEGSGVRCESSQNTMRCTRDPSLGWRKRRVSG